MDEKLKRRKKASYYFSPGHEEQPCQTSFFNSQKPRCKSNSRESKYLVPGSFFTVGFQKSSVHCFSTSAGISCNSLVQLAEHNKCHRHLPLVDTIMLTRLASSYSTYWPIYDLNNNFLDFTISRYNPYRYATTPPQVIRTIGMSRELQLQLARRNQLRRCGNALCFSFQVNTIHCFVSRRWNGTLFFLEPAPNSQ